MIERHDMSAPMLEVCPSLQPEWDEFVGEWQGEPGDMPYYLALSSLASHLVTLLDQGEVETVKAAMAVAEVWLLDGDQYVRKAATVGLLEDLQNTATHRGKTTPDDFIEFLLPESKYWWFKVVDFWEHGKLIVDDRGLED